MEIRACVLKVLLLCAFVSADDDDDDDSEYNDTDSPVNPDSRQLLEFRNFTKKPIGIFSTSFGKPVDLNEAFATNNDLLTNQVFIENLQNSLAERIPERVVHAKGTGAFGYFQVTHDITKYCKAKLFEKVGKITPLVARLSVGLENKGGNDLARDLRGLALKFYTEEGNLDLLSTQTPVYVYRDPILFGPVLRAFKRNPKTNLRDFNAALDFLVLKPAGLTSTLVLASPYGIPKGYRKTNYFPIHAFEIHNKEGESFFVRFRFMSQQGVDNFLTPEAILLSGIDPDYSTRDLYNAIHDKRYPSWEMQMDLMTEEQIKSSKFDPFDVSRLWDNGTYITVPIGRVVLDQNVDNQFADVEQAAYNPANLVPGIPGPPDQLFKGRRIAYGNTQIHRLGINKNKIQVNCPLSARTYNRDGPPPVLYNMGDAPNYFPNSFNGPEPYVDQSKPIRKLTILEANAVDLQPAADYYNKVLTEPERQETINNVALQLVRVTAPVRRRFLKLLTQTDASFGAQVTARLAIVSATLAAATAAVTIDPVTTPGTPEFKGPSVTPNLSPNLGNGKP